MRISRLLIIPRDRIPRIYSLNIFSSTFSRGIFSVLIMTTLMIIATISAPLVFVKAQQPVDNTSQGICKGASSCCVEYTSQDTPDHTITITRICYACVNEVDPQTGNYVQKCTPILKALQNPAVTDTTGPQSDKVADQSKINDNDTKFPDIKKDSDKSSVRDQSLIDDQINGITPDTNKQPTDSNRHDKQILDKTNTNDRPTSDDDCTYGMKFDPVIGECVLEKDQKIFCPDGTKPKGSKSDGSKVVCLPFEVEHCRNADQNIYH